MAVDTNFFATGAPGPDGQGLGYGSNMNSRIGGFLVGSRRGVQGRCGNADGELGAGVLGESFFTNSTGVIARCELGANAYGVWGISSEGYAGFFDGKVRVNGNLEITGAKAAVVPLGDGSLHYMYAMESPESWFEDFGFGQLVDGRAVVQLDEDFAAIVDDHPYHVFITEYDGNNGLYVTERTRSGFEVRSNSLSASSEFSYRVAAKRKDIGASRFAETADPESSAKTANLFRSNSPVDESVDQPNGS